MSSALRLCPTKKFLLLILVCVGLSSLQPSHAQVNSAPRSIEVVGTGTASAKPDQLVVKGFVTSVDKSAKKVLSKFNDTKKSIEETINPMDFPDVEIEFKDFRFNVNFEEDGMMMGGRDPASIGYRLSQAIEIRIRIGESDSEKSTWEMLSKLVDSADLIGVAFTEPSNDGEGTPQTSQAQGGLADCSSLNQEATKRAFEDAKFQAVKLAELSGGRLGRVFSIQASAVTGANAAASDSIVEIDVTQSLQIKFELID